MDIVAHQR